MKKKYKYLSLLLLSLVVFSCGEKDTTGHNDTMVDSIVDEAEASRVIDSLPEITEENHDSMMDMFFGKPKYRVRSIGILVYNGCNILDVMGPRYILGQIMGAKTRLVALEPGVVKTTSGIQIIPDTVKDSVDKLDILVIPGGFRGTIKNVYDEQLHEWIRKIDKTTFYTASVCTGGWVLGATGLLKGRKATTNWYNAEEMMEKYGAEFVKKRYVQDGKYWTAAGVTAGMDMSLAILNDILGKDYTQGVMLDMEYDPHPPIKGGTPDKTGIVMRYMMKSMYDAGVEPLIDSLETAKKLRMELP
ncbi:DJ-1/PfpI family protein [Aquimarina hainanensis]|uniref:DJ-1/PfpI family protein n=1 Tax=Aquimarina hainanensis TaxID=1578017 RepID=A0ABW5N925_9FLAO